MSTDDHATQCEFAGSLSLPFPLIADPDGTVARSFDVLWPFMKLVRRVTFVIDRDGILRGVFQHEIRVTKHVDDALACAKKLVAAPVAKPA